MRFKVLTTLLSQFISSIPTCSQEELFNFIDLPTLDERANIKSSKVGEYERNLFLHAFKTLISLLKNNSFTNMTPCWSSYQ